MVTLASVAFILAGLLFAVYAYLFLQVARDRLKSPAEYFAYAYFCMAAALVVWGIGAATGSLPLLRAAVTVGTSLLLIGTVAQLRVLFDKPASATRWAVGLGTAGSFVFMLWRQGAYPPRPVMQGGILLFQTAAPVSVALGLIFLLIWLPASLKMARAQTSKPQERPQRSVYYMVYVMATFAALLFLSARTPIMVGLSFLAICLVFVMLCATTLLAANHRKS